MQCMYGSPSSTWMKSVSQFFFFFFLKIQKWQNLVEARFRTQDSLKWKSECTDGRTYWMKSFYLSLKWKYQCKMSVCTMDGQTSFRQFSFSSVAYSQVSLSVRRSGAKKKLTDKHKTQIRGNCNWERDRWHIQEQTCRTINITFSQYAMHISQCNVMHVMHNAMQCTLMNVMQCNAMHITQCNAI
jgi:hypothetical protein